MSEWCRADLEAEIARLKMLVKDAEWADDSGRGESYPDRCPWCRESCEAHVPLNPGGYATAEGSHDHLDHVCASHAAACPAFTPSGEVR